MTYQILTRTGNYTVTAGTIQAALSKFILEQPHEYILSITEIRESKMKLPLNIEI